ncbi:hypothetical protein LWC34_09005 [Kibdelosporangium philippinense]|uniref:Major facilitator superfamily (MFS) profile domain-containing protein n=1 Tax=Kibdelosporangium philippinense TaxID=211113 RepID=A0ABS8Z8H1_9PSEU|nr:hypothetical protein [Kibdelosporangium philippinense]MCE7002966.1 hypothetical protein [Kibdelosporangium philippinense]
MLTEQTTTRHREAPSPPTYTQHTTYTITRSGDEVGGIPAASLAIPLIPAVGWQMTYLSAPPAPDHHPAGTALPTRISGIPGIAWPDRTDHAPTNFPLGSALSFLLVVNVGLIVGGRAADRVGSKASTGDLAPRRRAHYDPGRPLNIAAT